MANKITQLVNKAGDNLYPLAGGIMSDSVTTDMIQDGAVTSDKIDWTTFTIAAGDVALSNVNTLRVGNLVIINAQTASHTIVENESLGIIPLELRPNASVICNGVVQGTGANCTIAVISSSGIIQLQKCATIPSSSQRVAFSTVYPIS